MKKKITSKIHLIVLFVLLVFSCNTKTDSAKIYFYVATDGSNQNDGSFEKPFLNISHALNHISNLEDTNSSIAILIFIRKGVYNLDSTIVVQADELATNINSIVISSYKNEEVVISGGKRLTLNWTKHSESIVKSTVPDNSNFEEFFVNNKRQFLARYPNYNENVLPYGGFSLDADAPKRVANWKAPEGGYLHVLHKGSWGGYSFQITGKDNNNKLSLKGGWQNNRNNYGYHERYKYVENIFEELDTVNEWYLNKSTNTLYYYPPKKLNIETAISKTSVLSNLFEFRGTEENPLRSVTLNGLILRNSARTFMNTKEPLLRSDWTIYRGGMVYAEGTENLSITNNFFDAPGGNAIFFSNYNRGGFIKHNKITNAGASAISFVGDPKAVRSPSFEYREFVPVKNIDTLKGPKTNNYPSKCTAIDNLIYNVGVWEKQSAGIQISMASKIKINHNTIYNVPRSGINVSEGTWEVI